MMHITLSVSNAKGLHNISWSNIRIVFLSCVLLGFVSVLIECFVLLKVSPQFDINNQTPVEQWSKKPRQANRVKATDIFKSDPKRPVAHRERKTLGTVQNLKFHSDSSKTCRLKRLSGKHLPISKAHHHFPEPENPMKNGQVLENEQGMTQTFSSDVVHSSTQNKMTEDISVTFRPALASTPCAKKNVTFCLKDTVLGDGVQSNMDMLIPDPSPNVFRWCDNVFGVPPIEHQSIRSTVTVNLSPLKSCQEDIDDMQVSFEKLLVEQRSPFHSDSTRSEDRSLSVLAFDTPTRDGDYIMPYARETT